MTSRQHGFTLIEILLALAIFAVLAAAGIGLLRASLDSREAAETATGRIAALQRAHAILREDLTALRLRASRGRDGTRRPWRFLGNARPTPGEPLMAFLRGGWSNPGMGAPRSELVYIEYDLEDGALVRSLVPRPDPTSKTPETRQVLLDGLGEVRLSYFVQEAWREGWRVPADRGGDPPAAVALEMEIDGIGRMRQLFLATGAAS